MDRTKSRGAMWGLLALVVAIGLLGSALAAGPALAGKGGPNATTGGGPTITVSPSPVLVGASSITIAGSGFRAYQDIEVGVMGLTPSSFLTTDANGNFSTTYSPWGGFTMEGTGTAVALRNRGNKLVFVASTTFRVCTTNPC